MSAKREIQKQFFLEILASNTNKSNCKLFSVLLLPIVLHGLSTENTSLDNINNIDSNNSNSISDSGSVSNNLTMSEPLSHANSNYEPMVCAYVLLLMAIYWMTAALPLPVTSLIPLIAFPMFGVLSTVSF
jgi:di/tricarboxylate transporter